MKKLLLVLLSLTTSFYISSAQQAAFPAMCQTSELMQAYYNAHPQAQQERDEGERFTEQYVSSLRQQQAKTTAVDTYRIPVVFHVYGTAQGGKSVNDTVIGLAMSDLNKDFHGLNADYSQVNTLFMSLRSKINIRFILARKDPKGLPTTGIEYFPVKSGYANATGYDSQIAADAWDNYRYVNIFVMNDLFNDGQTNKSGVGTYPSDANNMNKTSRIVYNGAYLATNNANPEFASVLTHEFGHYFNLIHTFEGGCTPPNDNVADTPPCTSAQGCHTSQSSTTPLNCNGNLVNADNYMDYNICYKMFTKGQTDRMTAALYLSSRITLWQDSNLKFTGIYSAPAAGANTTTTAPLATLHPNPSNGRFYIDVRQAGVYDVTISDALGRVVYRKRSVSPNNQPEIDITGNPQGIYFLNLSTGKGLQSLKVQLLQ